MIPLLLNPPFKVGPAACVTHQFCGDIPICMAIYLIWTYDMDNHNGHNVYMCLCMHLFWDVHISKLVWLNEAIHGYSLDSFPHSIRACQYPHVNISHLQGSTSSGKVGEESTHLRRFGEGETFRFWKPGEYDGMIDVMIAFKIWVNHHSRIFSMMSDHCSFTNGIVFFRWAKWSWNKGKYSMVPPCCTLRGGKGHDNGHERTHRWLNNKRIKHFWDWKFMTSRQRW